MDHRGGTEPQHPRQTRQRAALETLLDELPGFLTAQEWHSELNRRGTKVGLATVYRTLQSLTEAGEVDMVRTPEGLAAYRACSTGHHHHLICRGCGKTVEVELPDFERWADAAAKQYGFADIDHELELFGLCGDCRA